jgi:sterol desaturase/sphingolipid hydroxylase (fatty acid hydroxylase superfamily)
MIGIPIALFAFNAGEWAAHKFLLPGMGKEKKSFFAYHFHEHHKESRKGGGYDENYQRPLLGWHAQGKEAASLAFVAAFWAPLFPVAPFFTGTVWYSLLKYYRVHKRAHLDPEWARVNLPWHYDHHMGPDQDKNWCVTRPWFDVLMGTRVPYVGTARELQDRARNAQRAASAKAAAERAPAVAPAVATDLATARAA